MLSHKADDVSNTLSRDFTNIQLNDSLETTTGLGDISIEACVDSCLSIHSLASEILLLIFLHLKATDRSWIRLTHVCRRWRLLAISTPTMWTKIHVSQSQSEHTVHQIKEFLLHYLNVIADGPQSRCLHLVQFCQRSKVVHKPRPLDNIVFSVV